MNNPLTQEELRRQVIECLSGLQTGVLSHSSATNTILAAISQRDKQVANEARIEAYKHILLSDVGMQEPLKGFLKNYIATLEKERTRDE